MEHQSCEHVFSPLLSFCLRNPSWERGEKKLLESRVNDPLEECSATTFAQLVAKEYSESKLMT